MINDNKILGLFTGAYVGDCLGMPVEGWTAARIKEMYGRVTTFLAPDHHKWFKGSPAGMTTDDWQLTKAVAAGLIRGLSNSKMTAANRDEAVDYLMDVQAEEHVKEFGISTNGWGNSTRNSVQNVSKGMHWSESGSLIGLGNGVAMKVAPIAAYSAYVNTAAAISDAINLTMKLGTMTHLPWISVAAGLAQMQAVRQCLLSEPEDFSSSDFAESVDAVAGIAVSCKVENVGEMRLSCPDIGDRLSLLANHKDYDDARIIKEFAGGGCYCYDSIPFSLMFFLKNPYSIETLFDVVNAGGDTDTNGSMVGALLGSLNGCEIFRPLLDIMSDESLAIISDVAGDFSMALEKFVGE